MSITPLVDLTLDVGLEKVAIEIGLTIFAVGPVTLLQYRVAYSTRYSEVLPRVVCMNQSFSD
jgi:hypothetical protein